MLVPCIANQASPGAVPENHCPIRLFRQLAATAPSLYACWTTSGEKMWRR